MTHKKFLNNFVLTVIFCTLVQFLWSCSTGSKSYHHLPKTAPALVNCLIPPDRRQGYNPNSSQSYPEAVILTTAAGCRSSEGQILTPAESEKKRAELLDRAETASRNYVPALPPIKDDPSAGSSPNGNSTITAPLELISQATGFIISKDGYALTNYHVAGDCTEVRVRNDGIWAERALLSRPSASSGSIAAVLAVDPASDLALLKLDGPFSDFAIFRSGKPIRPGNDVVLVGFPLPGILASEANVTKGSVSARAGLSNDSRFLQMTAPVQSGNSGGPVLDMSGRLVGVVVSKLDAIRIALVTGEIPQNINFAIKASTVKAFLESSNVPVTSKPSLEKVDAAEIVERAVKYTLPLECWR